MESVVDYLDVVFGDFIFVDLFENIKKDILKVDVCDSGIFLMYLENCIKVLEKGLNF